MFSGNAESLTEADTRAKLITPALHACGWTEDMIRREENAGAVEKIGNTVRRSNNRRTDYVLRVRAAGGVQPVAVALIEAKRNTDSPAAGMEQAKRYARRMNVPFVFSSNGFQFVEYETINGTQTLPRGMELFPPPAALRRRYEEIAGFNLDDKSAKPLLAPYCGGDGGRRYYQDAAIRAALEKTAYAEKIGAPPRVLLHLATGAGKTYIAAHLLKRIEDAGCMKRALFLCDRDALREQGLAQFRHIFGADAEETRRRPDGGNFAENARVHIATYQTLGIDESEDRESFGMENYPPNHFSHIVIDECHRSAWNKWRGILDRNPDAAHIGLTATPRGAKAADEDEARIIRNNYKYFGEPAYSYDLAQGAEDGYLALCEIHKMDIDLDKKGVNLDELMQISPTDLRTGLPLSREQLQKMYEKEDYEGILMLSDRIKAMCGDLFGKLAAGGNPLQKTIIFCVRREHAERVAGEMNNLYAAWRKETGAARTEPFAFVCMGELGGESLADFRAEDAHHFIAATVDLLSTGVDIPRVRNIAFFRYVRSPIILHQMLGRGARIYEPGGKLSFSVYDYTNATGLLGEGEWKISAASSSSGEKDGRPAIALGEGFDVEVSDSGNYVVVRGEGGALLRLSAEEYRQRLAGRLLARAATMDEFRKMWADAGRRMELLNFLRSGDYSPAKLGDLLKMENYDDYDILAESGYGAMPRTRAERVESFDYKNRAWLNEFAPEAALVLRALARRFAAGGIAELENPDVFGTPEIKQAGGVDALAKGGEPAELLHETKTRILAA